jgi:hypothetical protein
VFYLNGGQGIGIQSSPTNTHQSIVYAKAYQAFRDVNSGTTMSATDAWTGGTKYSTVYSTVNISTSSWQIYASICSPQQTLYLNTNPTKFLVNPGVSSVNTDFMYTTPNPYDEVNIDSVNSTIRFLGVRDIQLSSITTPQRAVFFSISTFTSEGYLSLSGEVSSLRSLSTTMPYHYRSSILLNSQNAFLKQNIQSYLSTPYTGVWLASFAGGPTSTINLQSTLGFPYLPLGLRGSNILSTSNNVTYNSVVYSNVNLTEINNSPYVLDSYLSTLTFNMSPFSTIINRNANTSITLSYTPSFLLAPSVVSGGSNNFNLGFSTFLTCGGAEIVPGTSVEDMFYAPNQSPASNALYGRLLIDIPTSYVKTHYLSNYSVYHRFPNAVACYSNASSNTWPPTSYTLLRPGLSTNEMTVLTSKQNSAYITIIGL